jgi:hypothetical protein
MNTIKNAFLRFLSRVGIAPDAESPTADHREMANAVLARLPEEHKRAIKAVIARDGQNRRSRRATERLVKRGLAAAAVRQRRAEQRKKARDARDRAQYERIVARIESGDVRPIVGMSEERRALLLASFARVEGDSHVGGEILRVEAS